MAITNTYIYGSNAGEANSNLHDWLAANAVPKYFDKVEAVSGEYGTDVICYVGEIPFLRFISNQQGSSAAYSMDIAVVTTANGTKLGFKPTNTGSRPKYIRATENGFFIEYHQSSSTSSGGMALCISKDNHGNTAAVAAYELNVLYVTSNDNNTFKVYPISTSTGVFRYINARKSSLFPITGLVPIALSDTDGAYMPNAFIMPYTQNTDHNVVLDIDGTKYLSNGIWCLRDVS